MKLYTHNLSGTALATAILQNILPTSSPSQLYTYIGTAAFLSIIINTSIDFIGHRGGSRSPYTHSITGSMVISIIVTIAISQFLHLVGVDLKPYETVAIALSCFSIALLHIALDLLTKGGVHLLWPFKKKRYGVLNIRYDNKFLNYSISLLSIVVLIYYAYNAIRAL